MLRLLILTILLAFLTSALAQPETDIYLYRIVAAGDTSPGFSVESPRNITPRLGYDNQPFFTPDGRYLLFVSMDDHDQTDVYRYDLERGSTERITRTRNRSEYSPTVTPKGDGYSAVVVEEDGTQRLWFFEWGDEKGQVMMDEITDIGYHAWYHKKRMAMFLLGEPPTLRATHYRRQKPRVLTDSIGRCIQSIPGEEQDISFVDKSEEPWRIMRWEAKSKEITEIAPCLPGSEDYAWYADWLWMGSGKQLFIRRTGADAEWQLVGEVEEGTITRLSVSPNGDYLAVVVRREDE